MKRSLLLACLPVVARRVSLGGCKPKAGASCKIETKEVCVDDKEALVCHDGKWEEMTCRGPDGLLEGRRRDVVRPVASPRTRTSATSSNDYVCTRRQEGDARVHEEQVDLRAELPRRARLRDGDRRRSPATTASPTSATRAARKTTTPAHPTRRRALVCRSEKFVVGEQLQGQERLPRHGRQEHGLQGRVRRLDRERRRPLRQGRATSRARPTRSRSSSA